jgi:hypothetical protein
LAQEDKFADIVSRLQKADFLPSPEDDKTKDK